MRSGSRECTSNKEVHLASGDGEGMFKGKCRNCDKVCRFKAKECMKRKGELHSGRNNGDSDGNRSIGGSCKTCNFCCLKGHKEAGCFKKFPELWPGTRIRPQRLNQLLQAWRCHWHHLTLKRWVLTYQCFKEKAMTFWQYCARRMCGFGTQV